VEGRQTESSVNRILDSKGDKRNTTAIKTTIMKGYIEMLKIEVTST